MRVPIAGGKPTRVARGQFQSGAVDANNLYWQTWDGHTSALVKMPIKGGKVTTLAHGTSDPTDLKVDAHSVYWTTWMMDSSIVTAAEGDGDVASVPIAGGAPVAIASRQAGPHFLALDSANVYWNNSGPRDHATLMKAPLAGGNAKVLATEVAAIAIAVDATRVYWTDYKAHAVMSVSLDGGTVTPLAEGLDYPNTMDLDSGFLYWANIGKGPTDSNIMKLAKPIAPTK